MADATEPQTPDEAPAEPVEVQPPAAASENPNAFPPWADIPGDLNIPSGAQVCAFRFMPNWTAYPSKGARQCLMWPLTDNDERVALVRCRDNPNPAHAANELAKQMIRAVDGVKVNWAAKRGQPGNIDDFWREIGPKCRNTIVRYYNRSHAMDVAETAYFLEHCVAVRTAS